MYSTVARLVIFVTVTLNTDGSPTRRKRQDQTEETRRPWQINQNSCPPVLCAAGIRGPGFEPSAGFPFFEGDIVRDLDFSQTRRRRDVIRPVSKLWRYGIIPYTIDQRLGAEARYNLDAAIATFEHMTCIRFRPKKDSDIDYISYIYQPGCWSYIGKIGGPQYVSLGPGCENYGTVLHETAHALGFWHEQSRPDRDSYVNVIEDNIPSRYLSQFGIRSPEESTTRGFAYDYQSIMHYGDKYFSSNDEPTLEVIGIGQRLGMTIGQREDLSDIDVAQLRDMYYCNEKSSRDKVCKEGWNIYQNHCYKFINTEPKTFSQARKYCEQNDGYLVNLETASEDRYIRNFLRRFYPTVKAWRTGGKRNATGNFVWVGKGGSIKPMNYSSWFIRHPWSFPTLVLAIPRGRERFIWRTTWAGLSGVDKYKYAFICESEPEVPCFASNTSDGRDYRGTLDYTTDGITCQYWTSQYPQQHTYMSTDQQNNARNGLGDHNYCRNPDGRRARPWCFIPVSPYSSKPRWQYCNVVMCT